MVRRGHKVSVIDNLSTGQFKNSEKYYKKIKFFNIDISQEKNKKMNKIFKKIDWVFHLAGPR